VPIGAGSLTFRVATSFDQDVARETAGGWAKLILRGDELAHDFGLDAAPLNVLVARVASGEQDVLAFARSLYAVALGLRLDLVIADVMRTDESLGTARPLRATRRDLGFLFRDPDTQNAFLEKALGPVFVLQTVGKDCAPESGTNSGAAQTDVPDA